MGTDQVADLRLADPGTTEALTSFIFGEGEDRLPDRVLKLGIVGPRPDASCPRPFEFVPAELAVTRMAICGEELLSFLDGGHIVRADSRMQRRSEADEDSFAIGGHAVRRSTRDQRLC